ncbi:MAG TPA: phosphate ABC transporter permease PstA [Acidimicrobiales bacterium]|nr:phosphate ABC transporter permease PstA [Acidimicrobiales bacterium]
MSVSLHDVAVSPRRRARNALATSVMWASLALAAIPLGFLIFYVVRKGLKVMSWKFLTKPIPVIGRTVGPGMGPAIIGTLLITALATLIAVPLGVLGAIYIVEYGADNRLARTIRFLGDVMAGVPSIVMGLFIYTIWVVRFHHFTGFAGALALACLMLPIVIRSSESMLRLVPRELREASFALGTSRSRTILTVVLPAAASGIISGCLLAVARAAGETAPLLFTVGLVSRTNTNLFKGQNTALSLQIFSNANQPYAGAQGRAWGAALTLMVIVLVFSISARVVSSKLTRIPR